MFKRLLPILLALTLTACDSNDIEKVEFSAEKVIEYYNPIDTLTVPEAEEFNDYGKSELEINGVDIPSYNGKPYIQINGNKPFFTETSYTDRSFEVYSELDEYGRCGVAFANLSQELMPTEERGQIGHVKPSGWQTIKYDIVDGKYLYNRCHLIGYQLAGENANNKNLITGTRYLNIDGMLKHENIVAEYIKNTGNHVLYRVTPLYIKDDLVASGVVMEGYSIEDFGKGINFCIFAYNVQPGIEIDYKNGESKLIGEVTKKEEKKYTENKDGIIYIFLTISI